MGQESCFFVCLFVFFYLAQSRQEEKKEGSITVLLSFCEFLVLVMVTHSAWRNLFLIPPTAPFCSKTPSLIFFFTHSLVLSPCVLIPSFFQTWSLSQASPLSLQLPEDRQDGEVRFGGGGGENIVARMSTPTHVHRQWTHMHSFTPPQKTQYNIRTRTHTHTQLLPVLPLKPPSEAPPWF